MGRVVVLPTPTRISMSRPSITWNAPLRRRPLRWCDQAAATLSSSPAACDQGADAPAGFPGYSLMARLRIRAT